MKPCPHCQSAPTWILGDGRFKCRSCGLRYSWKSVWDSIRLPEDTKQHLLDAFVEGIPVYQQRFDDGACIDSRERFYRLARACCAFDRSVTAESVHIAACDSMAYRGSRNRMRGWSTASHVMIVGITENNDTVQLTPPPVNSTAELIPLLRERTAIGGIYCIQDNYAVANLQVQGDYVVMDRSSRASLAMRPAEVFWNFAKERLQAFRKIPCKFVHLYLAEMSYRFNYRDTGAGLGVMLYELLHSLGVDEVRAVLRGATLASRGETLGQPAMQLRHSTAAAGRARSIHDTQS